jgi:hypothetical protein
MFSEALPFITSYVSALAQELHRPCLTHRLSKTQQSWMSFCLTALLLTNSLCWAAFWAGHLPYRCLVVDVSSFQDGVVGTASSQR